MPSTMESATQAALTVHAQRYLQYLCTDIPTRTLGTPGSRTATDYVAGLLCNPDVHWRIVAALEVERPPAIVAATARNLELAGAACPCLLIEDGDFDVPSVYMTEEEGVRGIGR